MLRRAVFYTLAIALCLTAVPAVASTFVAMSPRELVAGSDAIIQGRVIGQQSSWSHDGRIVVTEVTVKVRDVLAGQAPDVVKVQVPGGRVGDYSMVATGFPTFKDREKVILFVSFEGASTGRVVGHQLGHWEVVERLDGVKMAVPRTEDGASFFDRSGRLTPEPESVPLADFKRGIRRIERDTIHR
ncbi:MAG: hypothetical protein R3325_04440 [Thermoanaerobaculia bacterium]|nr:hypothetical protein [Thermoanaerobaculia bacterium]